MRFGEAPMTTTAAGTDIQAVSDAERDEAATYLTLTREGLLRAVAELSERQWRWSPGPGRWSVHQIVEHVAVVEGFFHERLAARLLEGPILPPGSETRLTDAQVMLWEPDPGTKVVIPGRVSLGEAPPQLAPVRLENPADSLSRFVAARERTAVFLETAHAELRARAVEQPALGPLDGYQWVLFLAAHSARHTKQILGVLADAGFPRPGVDSGRARSTNEGVAIIPGP